MIPRPPREARGVLQDGAEFVLCFFSGGDLSLCSSSASGRVPAEGREQDAFLGTSAISTVGLVGRKSKTNHLCPLLIQNEGVLLPPCLPMAS